MLTLLLFALGTAEAQGQSNDPRATWAQAGDTDRGLLLINQRSIRTVGPHRQAFGILLLNEPNSVETEIMHVTYEFDCEGRRWRYVSLRAETADGRVTGRESRGSFQEVAPNSIAAATGELVCR